MTNAERTTYDPDLKAFKAGMGHNAEIGMINQQKNAADVAFGKYADIKELPGIFDINPNNHALLIGAGSSITRHIEAFKQARIDKVPIFACNGVGHWMVEQGIGEPDFICTLDPRERVLRYFTGRKPIHGAIVALNCDTSILKHLDSEGIPTTVYRSMQEAGKPVVNGGSTVTGRMLSVLSCLGFKHIHMFGADSNFGWDGEERPYAHPDDGNDPVVEVSAAPGYRIRKTTPNLAAQAWEIPQILKNLVEHRGNAVRIYDPDTLVADFIDAATKGLIDYPDQGLSPFVQTVDNIFGTGEDTLFGDFT